MPTVLCCSIYDYCLHAHTRTDVLSDLTGILWPVILGLVMASLLIVVLFDLN